MNGEVPIHCQQRAEDLRPVRQPAHPLPERIGEALGALRYTLPAERE